MVKGHLTGCGLHGYGLVFFFLLTRQSNIAGCLNETSFLVFQVLFCFICLLCCYLCTYYGLALEDYTWCELRGGELPSVS